jgi:predicted kinase
MNTKLILVRGASWSGKSTYARKLAEEIGAEVYEADYYFLVNGEYVFDPKKLGWAHKSNQDRTRKSLEEGKTVIVANTLTTSREIRDYTSIAESLGIPVEVYRSNATFGNVHGVPDEKVAQMRARMVDYPGEVIINS